MEILKTFSVYDDCNDAFYNMATSTDYFSFFLICLIFLQFVVYIFSYFA